MWISRNYFSKIYGFISAKFREIQNNLVQISCFAKFWKCCFAATLGSPVCQEWGHCLEGLSTLGVTGHVCHSQWGDWSVGFRGGLAAAAGGAWSATATQWAARWHGRAPGDARRSYCPQDVLTPCRQLLHPWMEPNGCILCIIKKQYSHVTVQN